MTAEINQWDKPIVIDPKSRIPIKKDISKDSSQSLPDSYSNRVKGGFSLISPEDFYLFSIPFKSKNPQDEFETSEIPWKLPEKYEEAITNKKLAAERFRNKLREMGFTKEERKA